MIKLIQVALLVTIATFATSCQSEEFNGNEQDDLQVNTTELTSTMSDDEFIAACHTVKSQMGPKSRAVVMTESGAKEIVQPFVEDGILLREQIVKQMETSPNLKEDVLYFKALTEEDCAALSFTYHSMKNAGFEAQFVNNMINKKPCKLSPEAERFVHCLAVAVGYDTVKKLSVEGIITATTVRQAIIAIGKRYLGYIGVALVIKEFVECIE